jgi:predicted nucleotidyltransferase
MTDVYAEKFGLSPKVISQIQSVFARHPQIQKVILYGSRAKGNFKPGSDIDLTMICANPDLSLLFKIENELDDLLLPYKIDLSLMSLIDNANLIDHINRVGIEFWVATR